MARTGRSFPSAPIPQNNPKASATIGGTITAAVTEADIVTGGKTLTITLSKDTWIPAGASSFDLQRDEILAGVFSAQSETFGWNNVVLLTQSLSGIVRTSDTVVTITWDAFPTYNVSVQETISVTVPQTALKKSKNSIPATPIFIVSPVIVVTTKIRDMITSDGIIAYAR